MSHTKLKGTVNRKPFTGNKTILVKKPIHNMYMIGNKTILSEKTHSQYVHDTTYWPLKSILNNTESSIALTRVCKKGMFTQLSSNDLDLIIIC